MLKDQDGFPDKDLSCDLKQCKKDNCPQNANADQADLDKDGEGDICESDLDADGDGIQAYASKIKNDEEVCTVGRKARVVENFVKCKDGVDPCPCNYEDRSGCQKVKRVAACVRAKL